MKIKSIVLIALFALMLMVGCTPSPDLQIHVIENYPQLFLDDHEFCCELRNANLDSNGNFVMKPDQYIEMYIDLKEDHLTVVEYNYDVVTQYDYTFVIFDYEPIVNSSGENILIRTGLLTDWSNRDNKILFRYAFHDGGYYAVMEVNGVAGPMQYILIPIQNITGNM